MSKMKVGSLFSGIGGFDLGLVRAGMEIAWQVEIDPFCQKVLKKHAPEYWPNAKLFGDIKNVTREELCPVELICGGFPCQPFSNAGWRNGSKDNRNLWPEYFRIIKEIRPKWVIAENVASLLTSERGRFFLGILRDLASIGYDAEWHVISACSIGFPHVRKRLFIIAYPAGNGCKRNLLEVDSQKIQNISSKTLGTRNWLGYSLSDIPKLLASPGNCRLPDGIPSTLAIRPALRGYGNAVIPQIIEILGRCILEV